MLRSYFAAKTGGAAALAMVLALHGCSGAAAPVQVGAAGPWSEAFGELNRAGIELAVEEINSSGGIRGRPLQVVFRDDGGEGSRAAQIAGEFLQNSDIVAVIGHVTSGAMMAAARVYDRGLPAVATTASAPDLSGISPWVFRVITSDSANGITIARFLAQRGVRRVAVLYENNPYGRGLATSFRRSFNGLVISSDPIPSDPKASFEPYVSYLKRRGPEAVFVASTNAPGLALLREARRQRLAALFVGGDGWSSIVSDTLTAEGVYVATPFTAYDPRAEAQRFVTAFRTKYRRDPDGNAALAYDATMLLARAIAEAGESRSRIRQWLAGLSATEPFRGVTGPIRFLPSGDVVGRGVTMTRVRTGALLVERDGL
ncbi:MAG TPA: ABC transporter substrate-binding protein [Gemmatimonadaceae bacterium]|nr:ABC transporter substrate-binding protein [Gemmatimonadaceae bacterium]